MATLSLYVLALYVLPIMVSSESHSYIVHMDSSLKPTPFLDHPSWYSATLSSLSDGSNGETKLIYTYTEAIQGFSAILTPSELQALTSTPGFVSYSRNRPLNLLTTHSSQFLGLTPKYGAWPVSNYGEDVIIGLLDTGVWPESVSYRDEGMPPVPSRWKGTCESGTQFNSSYCNNKLIGARFYNKGYMAEHPNKKISMHSVRDTDGHGTHTSSTAAGNFIKGASYFGYASGTAKGMAPRARLAIYKVAWFGEVSQSDLLAGVDQAIRDGVDSLSISLAGFTLSNDTKLENDPVAVATFAAMKKGIFVAAAAGNEGPEYFTLGNGAPWAMIVGAGTMDRKLGGLLTLGNGRKITFKSLYLGILPSDAQLSLVFNNSCQSAKEIEGKILVCRYDSRIDILENDNSAPATIFITNATVPDSFAESFYPAAFVGDHDGKMLINYIKLSSNPTGALVFRKTFIDRKPAPQIDVYSSRGPSPSCPGILKPDIIAPGTSILASWSTNSSVSPDPWHPLYSNFYLAEGTSMATPHVAGVAALLKSVHRDWSPAAIRSALMTTANPFDNNDSPIKDAHRGLIANPLAIGAGHISPNKALNPGLVYDAEADDYKKLLCAMNYTAKQIQTITGSTYRCSNWSNTEQLNYPSFIAYFNSHGSNSSGSVVQEFRRTLTNVGQEQSSYFVNLTTMAGLKLKVEPQRLVFTKKYEKLRYKLTMIGPKLLKDDVVQGSLCWIDDGGKYVVRSPIVATNIVPDSLRRE